MKKLLSVAEVAEMLGFTPKHVRYLITDKGLKAYRFGTEYRLTEEFIDEFLEANLVNAEPKQKEPVTDATEQTQITT